MSSFSLSTLLNPQVSRFCCRYGSFLLSSCRGNFVSQKLAQRKNESKIDERVKGVKIHVRGRLCGSRTFLLVLFCSFFVFVLFSLSLFLSFFFKFFLSFFFLQRDIPKRGRGDGFRCCHQVFSRAAQQRNSVKRAIVTLNSVVLLYTFCVSVVFSGTFFACDRPWKNRWKIWIRCFGRKNQWIANVFPWCVSFQEKGVSSDFELA